MILIHTVYYTATGTTGFVRLNRLLEQLIHKYQTILSDVKDLEI